MDFFKTFTDDAYNYTAVSANDNPPLLSGKPAHERIALFWKRSFDKYVPFDNFISPLKSINSGRVVGKRCDFPNSMPLFVKSVQPTLSHLQSPLNKCNLSAIMALSCQNQIFMARSYTQCLPRIAQRVKDND